MPGTDPAAGALASAAASATTGRVERASHQPLQNTGSRPRRGRHGHSRQSHPLRFEWLLLWLRRHFLRRDELLRFLDGDAYLVLALHLDFARCLQRLVPSPAPAAAGPFLRDPDDAVVRRPLNLDDFLCQRCGADHQKDEDHADGVTRERHAKRSANAFGLGRQQRCVRCAAIWVDR